MKDENKRVRDWLAAASRRDFDKILWEAMLIPEHVHFLNLRYKSGLRYKEISEATGHDETYIKRAFSAAYRKIGGVLF